ncbi:hypothetical protein [Reyranella sp.]|uniref:hypothetical protein n=1 Tax=Reyranella sp. TaxID=1929291 RepID=UPI003C7CCE14
MAARKGCHSFCPIAWRLVEHLGEFGVAVAADVLVVGPGDDGYSDNLAMARWLQQTVQGMLNPELKDLSIPVIDADFSKAGDPRYFWTEYVSAADGEIALTWHDIGDPLLIHTEPNQEPNPRPYGVCTVLVPALSGRLTLNGQQARGKPWPGEREGRPFSTSALAFWGELDRTPLEV